MNFDKLTAYLDGLNENWNIPAGDLLVTLDGKEIYRHFAGVRDAAGKTPLNGKETYWIYSMTKPVTMACALRLMEEGKLALDDAVCEYLPTFSKYPSMTVEHLMSMRGGLDYELEFPGRAELGAGATTLQLVSAMANKPLHFVPGTDFQYSLCHDVLGGVIEVASGMRLSEYMQKTFFDPLGMTRTGFYLNDDSRENMCAQYERVAETGENRKIPDFENVYRLTEQYEAGGAGLITTVEDYGKFVTAIACGGSGFLTMESINAWRGRSLKGKAKETFDTWERWGYNYALGVRVMEEPRYSKGPAGEFGWDGAAGAWCLMDPEARLAAVFCMHVKACGPAYSDVHPAIRDLIYCGLRDE